MDQKSEPFALQPNVKTALPYFNRQVNKVQEGYPTSICEQGLCTFCKNFFIAAEDDWWCEAGCKRFDDGPEIFTCYKFRQIRDWKLKMYQILINALYQVKERLVRKIRLAKGEQ